jgi:hypothetical protein
VNTRVITSGAAMQVSAGCEREDGVSEQSGPVEACSVWQTRTRARVERYASMRLESEQREGKGSDTSGHEWPVVAVVIDLE